MCPVRPQLTESLPPSRCPDLRHVAGTRRGYLCICTISLISFFAYYGITFFDAFVVHLTCTRPRVVFNTTYDMYSLCSKHDEPQSLAVLAAQLAKARAGLRE